MGGKDTQGRRIANGRLDTVRRVSVDGAVEFDSGLKIGADHGHLDHGYCQTSFASQGRDAPLAICAMGRESLAATNRRQFYVTASRTSKDLEIYVDDKDAVRRAIQRSDEQVSATEMLRPVPVAKPKPSVDQRYHIELRRRIERWWRNRRRTS